MQDDVSEPPEYVAEHLREVLAGDPRSSELDVQVTIRGQTLHLDGFAATAEHRDRVSEVAQAAAPGFAVRNDMTVGPFPEDDRVEDLP